MLILDHVHDLQKVVFVQLIQGNTLVEEFSAQIKKISKIAGMTPEDNLFVD